MATKRYVRKLLAKQAETKYFELGVTATGVDYAGTLTNLTVVPQGTTDSTRIGDKLVIRGLNIKYEVIAADSTQMVRVMLFQWHPNTQLLSPIMSDILVSTTLSTTNAPLANNVWDYQNQYTVLYDRVHRLDSLEKASDIVRKNINLRYAKKTIVFYAATTAASEHIYMLVVSDSSAAPHPTIQYQTRLTYDDS